MDRRCVLGWLSDIYCYPTVALNTYSDDQQIELAHDALVLLKEQDERLRKLQKDKDKLCLEVSEWKHKFHDVPPKFVSQGVVDQIRWERDTALSQLEQIGKGLGSKMDDIVAMLKEQPQIVRCKDCKKHDTYDCNITYLTTQKTPNDWFCADGERKDDHE